MTDNDIAEGGGKALGEALKVNSTLKELNVECKSQITYSQNEVLLQLTLFEMRTGNKLGDAGAEALSEGLKTNSGLTELNLIGNHRWHPNKTQTTKNMLLSLFNREQDWKRGSQSAL